VRHRAEAAAARDDAYMPGGRSDVNNDFAEFSFSPILMTFQ
jgi:hypothetical protein